MELRRTGGGVRCHPGQDIREMDKQGRLDSGCRTGTVNGGLSHPCLLRLGHGVGDRHTTSWKWSRALEKVVNGQGMRLGRGSGKLCSTIWRRKAGDQQGGRRAKGNGGVGSGRLNEWVSGSGELDIGRTGSAAW
jgi:hypothetical protein